MTMYASIAGVIVVVLIIIVVGKARAEPVGCFEYSVFFNSTFLCSSRRHS